MDSTNEQGGQKFRNFKVQEDGYKKGFDFLSV